MIGEQGANYLSVAPRANFRLTSEHIDKVDELISTAAIVVLQYEIFRDFKVCSGCLQQMAGKSSVELCTGKRIR